MNISDSFVTSNIEMMLPCLRTLPLMLTLCRCLNPCLSWLSQAIGAVAIAGSVGRPARTGRTARTVSLILRLMIGAISLAGPGDLSVLLAQNPPPEPGAVRLSNGLIFRGMCSTTSRFIGDEAPDQRLELRMIDQGYRRIYVSNRRSEPVVANPNDWPAMDFAIRQRRTGRKSVPDIIGIPEISPFNEDGTAVVRLRLGGGKIEEIQVGITRINELYAEVSALSHNWTYAIAVRSIPPQRLFPGILQKVARFDSDPFVRLELSRMLIRCGMLIQAEQMLQSITADFPEAEATAQLPALTSDFRSELGRQILQDLELRRDSGQFQLALNSGRIFPRTQLSPEVQLRTRQLVDSIEELSHRVATVRTRLLAIMGRIEDPEHRVIAGEMIPVLVDALDLDSVERFSAFELLAGSDDFPPENQLALAASGWLLGADEAIPGLREAFGLFEARQLVLDYLRTNTEEAELRAGLLRRISVLEGVSIQRLAKLVRNLPPIETLFLQPPLPSEGARFQISGDAQMMGCAGMVAPEYHESRSYPLIIALPREGVPVEATLEWWGVQAARYGYIVVVPEIYSADTGVYDASAEQHARFLQLIRRLKLGLRVDDDRIFVAGHGIGGEAAMDLATSHTELFAGIISIAGLGRRHIQWTAENEPAMPWYVVIGGRQGLWTERLSILLSKLFRRSGDTRTISDLILVKYPDRGFESYFEETPALFEWMSRYRRTLFPEQMKISLMRSSDLRWSWLELESLPRNFALLDQPTHWNDGPFAPAAIEARLTKNNAIVISRVPQSPLHVKLSPEMPGIDLQKPITIVVGSERKTVDFAPAIADLLEELRLTGDRSRLCFMKIPMKSR